MFSNRMSFDNHPIDMRIAKHQKPLKGGFFDNRKGKVVIGDEITNTSLETAEIEFNLSIKNSKDNKKKE